MSELLKVPFRTCRKCSLTSTDLELFRKDKKSKHGREQLCLVCEAKRTSQWRKTNPEKASASNKKWKEANQDCFERYAERKPVYNRNYSKKHPEKIIAHKAVHEAIRQGDLTRPDFCSECAVYCSPEGHHDDYDKPLEVRWLCTKCHKDHHKQKRNNDE